MIGHLLQQRWTHVSHSCPLLVVLTLVPVLLQGKQHNRTRYMPGRGWNALLEVRSWKFYSRVDITEWHSWQVAAMD